MKHPDDQWLGYMCKNKAYMKIFCLYIMVSLQGNFLPIDYVCNASNTNLIDKYACYIFYVPI